MFNRNRVLSSIELQTAVAALTRQITGALSGKKSVDPALIKGKIFPRCGILAP